MSRDIVETEEIDKDMLDGVIARLEKDCHRSSRTDFEALEAELHMNYTVEKSYSGGRWTGQVCVEVYGDYFRARGDGVLLTDYFAENQIRELELE
ncbi:MAG: hypothetical protein ABEJ36_04915 [Candidatus Nanosalina sp.]